ncbi:hypothetical protein Sango_1565300 [Sesamum angolense]|uniref:DUF4218 domain-containing protein n=1 Tax=Sesamum angolense TaxID=2727404 RepID=A0AAE1WQA0_9LAMI|nr:hypothetical protein Sango_1565300 [Sesamum angolense]
MWFRDYSCEALVADTWLFFVADYVAEHMTCLISKIDNQELCMIPSSDEIWNTVFARVEEKMHELSSNVCPNLKNALASSLTATKLWSTFSRNVTNKQKEAILEILQMLECDHRAKHLGLYPFICVLDGAPNDGTRSSPTYAGSNSYYGGSPCDYVSRLADQFPDVVPVADQLLWNGSTQSQLGVVSELVDIKVDGPIFERIYDRVSLWVDHILPHDHTLPLNYYNTKKLIKDLDLPMEKIDASKPRNVRLGLCTDGFAPHEQYGRTVIDRGVVEFVACGILMRECAKDKTFTMRVMLMWTVNDLPVYGIAYGWSTTSVIGCPELRLHGMKRYDCHVFMQKLIPIAFCEILPESVWSVLTEVSLLFQILCSTMLDVNKVQELEASAETILCNHEKIFPPTFFDSMEHLIVHLPYEARVRGPVQYRPRRNDDLTMNDTCIQQSLFNYPGRASGVSKKRWLSGSERHLIVMYILTNCEVVTPYYGSFLKELYDHHHSKDPIIEELVATQFKDWFKRCVSEIQLNYIDNELLKLYYWGPTAEITTFEYYFVSGYNFHSERHSMGKSSLNCGMCVAFHIQTRTITSMGFSKR